MRRFLLFCLALLLVACGSNVPATNAPRNPPTLAAPVWAVGDTPITAANVQTARYLGRLDPPDTAGTWFDAALSPDATALGGLAALNAEQFVSWDLLTGQPLFYTGRGSVTRIVYSPDKSELYGVMDTGVTGVFDALTGEQTTSFAAHPAYAGVAAFDPANGWLALGGTDDTIRVWDAPQRVSRVTLNADSTRIMALVFSGDGARLVSAANDGSVRVWDWQTRAEIDSTRLDGATITRLTASPDGARVAVGTTINTRLWTLGADAAALDTGAADTLLFNGDGRFLVAGSRSSGLSLWDGVNGTFIGVLPNTQGDSLSAAFSPDGTLLVTAALNHGVFLWNLEAVSARALEQAALDVGTTQIHRVAWSADGRLILLFDAVGAVYAWGIK